MNDSEVLLDKADALLLRLRSSTEMEFPVLTEIVELSSPSGSHRKLSPTPKHSNPLSDVEVNELCQSLRAQLIQSLERTLEQRTDEALLGRLRQECELALEIRLKCLMEDVRKEILLDIEKTLEELIETEVHTRLSART